MFIFFFGLQKRVSIFALLIESTVYPPSYDRSRRLATSIVVYFPKAWLQCVLVFPSFYNADIDSIHKLTSTLQYSHVAVHGVAESILYLADTANTKPSEWEHAKLQHTHMPAFPNQAQS